MRIHHILAATAISLVFTGCSSLQGFVQRHPEKLPEPVPPTKLQPLQLVQRLGAFAFCTDCPSPSEKRISLAVDANSPNAAARALARLRENITKGVATTGQRDKLLIAEIPQHKQGDRIDREAQQGPAPTNQPWAIFALVGAPEDPAMQAAFTKVVRLFRGSSFHLIGDASSIARMDAFEALLHRVGDPNDITTTSLLQTYHPSDETLQGEGATGRPLKGVQMLVIRK